MLLEFDADQRLWRDTVRDAVAKQCPPTLVRAVAEQGLDPMPLWKVYVDTGWTELTDPANAVELAIVLEELGRATDPTPYLATMTQFAPLAGDRHDPQRPGAAVYNGVTAHRDADANRWCSVMASSRSARWASRGRTTCSSRSSGPRPAT